MSVTVQPIKVVGLQHAMSELAAVDKRALKGFRDEYKTIVMPMLQEAKHAIPTIAPMSGWNRSWVPRRWNTFNDWKREDFLPWQGREKNLIKPFINNHRRRRPGSSGVAFGIRWNHNSAMLFDMTGKGNPSTEKGNRMESVLGQRYGAPSRAMWRAFDVAGDDVQREMVKLINKIMKATGRNIQTRRFR
jgi:hypothetical protein